MSQRRKPGTKPKPAAEVREVHSIRALPITWQVFDAYVKGSGSANRGRGFDLLVSMLICSK